MARLQIGRILLGALATTLENAVRLAQALAIPAVLFLILSLIEIDPENPNGPVMALTMILTIVLHTVVAVTAHRITILGPNSIPPWGLNRWTIRETRFLVCLLALGFGAASLLIVSLALPQPFGAVIALLFAIVLGSAFSLIFPAVALEHEMTFRQTWLLARGNLFPLVVCVWLFPITLSVPIALLAMVPYTAPILVLLQMAANALTIAALSLAYTELRRNPSAQE